MVGSTPSPRKTGPTSGTSIDTLRPSECARDPAPERPGLGKNKRRRVRHGVQRRLVHIRRARRGDREGSETDHELWADPVGDPIKGNGAWVGSDVIEVASGVEPGEPVTSPLR